MAQPDGKEVVSKTDDRKENGGGDNASGPSCNLLEYIKQRAAVEGGGWLLYPSSTFQWVILTPRILEIRTPVNLNRTDSFPKIALKITLSHPTKEVLFPP